MDIPMWSYYRAQFLLLEPADVKAGLFSKAAFAAGRVCGPEEKTEIFQQIWKETCGWDYAPQTADENCHTRLIAIISVAVDDMKDFSVH